MPACRSRNTRIWPLRYNRMGFAGWNRIHPDPGSGYVLRATDSNGDVRFFLRTPHLDSTLLTLSDPNGEFTDFSTGVNAISIYNQDGALRLRIGLDENNPIDGGGGVSSEIAAEAEKIAMNNPVKNNVDRPNSRSILRSSSMEYIEIDGARTNSNIDAVMIIA